ncbi:MAG: potassium-transporting ATPase subunit KdpC [Clostridia bacterium]
MRYANGKQCFTLFGKALAFLLVMTVVCGVLYPLAVTGLTQIIFPWQANGSLITVNGVTYGSEHIGQPFTQPNHLWGRPMTMDITTFADADGAPLAYGWASNKSPAGAEQNEVYAKRVSALRAAHPEMGEQPIPVDLITESGSGLDPAISPEAAEYQVKRIAANTGKTDAAVRAIIASCTTGRLLGIFGEPTVNVLKVNLALDGILQ